MPISFMIVTVFGTVLIVAVFVVRSLILNYRAQRANWDARVSAGRLYPISVRQLELTRGSSEVKNGISPLFGYESNQLRFCILSEVCWPFDQITSVDLGRSIFGADVIIETRQRERLRATVTSRQAARDLLTALPPNLPLTKRAAELLSAPGK